MNQKNHWEKLASYFAGELTGTEEDEMEAWIEEDSKREEQVKILYQIWKESETLPYPLDVNVAWDELEGRIDLLETELRKRAGSVSPGQPRLNLYRPGKAAGVTQKPGSVLRRVALAAASVLVMITSGIFTHHYQSGVPLAEVTEEVTWERFATSGGERAVFTLNDGSRVVLHANSRREVPGDFNRNNRELFLEGEAYFEVLHNPELPFVVHSGDAFTRVLGTRFLVQAWPDENRMVEVIVEEGRVALGENRQVYPSPRLQPDRHPEVIITRNQKGVLVPGSSPTVSDITDIDWYLGWTEGRLVFEDRPLREVLLRLEHWYDVDIHAVEPMINEKRLTAEIDYSQPMLEVITGIALTLDLEFEREGRTITFRPVNGG